MSAVSKSPGALQKIDFVEAMLRTPGIVPRSSAAFDEPGALGIACVSFNHRLHSHKPPDQAYHGIGYRVSGAETIRMDRPGGCRGRVGTTGMTAIVPAQEESWWESAGPHEMVHFYLSSRLLTALAEEIFGFDGARVQLCDAGFHVDPTIGHWAMMYRDRLLEQDPLSELELNAAAQLIGAHLLRRYSNLADRRPPDGDRRVPSTLSPMQVKRVQEFIKANLSRDLGLSEMAEQARLSPHYFSMRFKSTLGVSPHRYVLGERIREAQKLLAGRRMSILEVGLSLGFSDQSHFSQTFRKLTGITPKRYQSTC